MRRILVSTTFFIMVGGCVSQGPENVRLEDVEQWLSYTNTTVGYNLIYLLSYCGERKIV